MFFYRVESDLLLGKRDVGARCDLLSGLLTYIPEEVKVGDLPRCRMVSGWKWCKRACQRGVSIKRCVKL